MRATTTITWLLLSLSFLFHSVCCDENQDATVSKNATTAMPVPAGGSTSATGPTVSDKLKTDGTTGTPAGKDNQSTLAPIPAKPTTAITTPAPTVTATPKPTIKPNPTQPQLPTVTNSAVHPATIPDSATTVVNNVTPAVAATSALPKATTQTPMANNSGSLLASQNAATIQTPGAWQPSETPRTEAPTRQSGNTANVGTTKMPQVSTDALTTRKESMAHTTVTANTDQLDNKRTGTPAVGPSGTKAGTTDSQAAPTAIPATSTTTTSTAHQKMFSYSLNKGHEKEEEKDLAELCKRLMVYFQDGNCDLSFRHHNDKILFDGVKINGIVKTDRAAQLYEEITKKPTDNKTLIAILASCGALLIMIVILAVCASHHRKPYNENQQHLTEELHTVENGYHDNPTLEVMEVQPEMQEKKMALNGEFNDNWIVPIDNLLKEDMPDEEDTHL